MKKISKKSLILMFTVLLLSSGCKVRKNKVNETNVLPKPEIINKSQNTNNKEVSPRGRVLCFKRARKEKNEFLSKIAYENCILTIDKNLKKFDEKQAELYFLEKKDNKIISKPKKVRKKIMNKTNPKVLKKKKKIDSKVVNIKNKENSCKEGTIAGGAIGAGIGMATAKGKNKWWAVPTGGAVGAIIGCQIDGG